MSEQQALPIGTIVRSGSHGYRIERVLGQGGFGITYMASYQDSGSGVPVYVALKEFFMKEVNGRSGTSVTTGREDGLFGSHRRKFAREANNLRKLNHPNIIRVMDYFELNNTSYYAMEYLDGGSLDQYIQKSGALKEDEAIRMVRQVGAALSYVHSQGMLHLDLKPGNIMLRRDGSIVLIDFGLSKQYDAGGNPESSTTIKAWTEGYAPMEQTASHGMKGFPITIDVYALGATLYKMVTGLTPPLAFAVFDKTVRLKDALTGKGVSPNTIAAIEKAMAPAKADRFQSVNDFMRRLMTAEEIREEIRRAEQVHGVKTAPTAPKPPLETRGQLPKNENTVIEGNRIPKTATSNKPSSQQITHKQSQKIDVYGIEDTLGNQVPRLILSLGIDIVVSVVVLTIFSLWGFDDCLIYGEIVAAAVLAIHSIVIADDDFVFGIIFRRWFFICSASNLLQWLILGDEKLVGQSVLWNMIGLLIAVTIGRILYIIFGD